LARAKKPKEKERRRPGDGSITEIAKDQHYLLRWFEPDPMTDKKHQRSKHCYGTERHANDEIRRILVSVDAGKNQPCSNRTPLDELADEYLAHVERACKKRTYYSYSDTLRKHVLPTLGQIPASQITPKQVRNLLAAKEREPQPSKKKNPSRNDPVKYYSGRTIEYIQVVLHAMFEFAIDLKYIEENPAELKKSFAINLIDPDDPDELDREDDDDENDVPIWTREQFLVFHKKARDDYFYPAYCIAATQGKRRGEVLGIKWKRVNLDTGKIFIRIAVQRFPGEGIQPCSLKNKRKKKSKKKSKPMFIVLGPEVLALLRQHYEEQQRIKEAMGDRYHDEDWAFCRPDGRPYDPKTCSKHFKKICKKAWLPPNTTLHHLRHNFTTYMQDFYLSLRKVQLLNDHANIQATAGYDHDTFERQKNAALAMEGRVFPESPHSPNES
jgi:integrase